MKLAAFFSKEKVLKEADFSWLSASCVTTRSESLVYSDSEEYLLKANQNRNAVAVITTAALASKLSADKGVVVSATPRDEFYSLHNHLVKEGKLNSTISGSIGTGCEIHPTAIVSAKARIGNNVKIGAGSIIHDGVTIGDNVFIDSAAVIGCDGILYFQENGNKIFVRHAGEVQVGKNSTVLSNAVIVKSVNGAECTRVGENTIIGISSTIGHEAQVGNNCVISGNCVVARLSNVGDNAWIGSSAVLREHVRVGKSARVNAGSVVIENVGDGESVSGNFALHHLKHLKAFLRMKA